MRLSKQRERDLIHQIQDDPYTCRTVDADDYTRADGHVLVHRDHVQEFLHRRLYRILINPGLKRGHLMRVCETWGCVNPNHYRENLAAATPSRSVCPSGHNYLPGNLTPSGHCRICTEKRIERARTVSDDTPGLNARKTHCPANHEYTPENTYTYPSKTTGMLYRKCRTCTALRNAARKSATVRRNEGKEPR